MSSIGMKVWSEFYLNCWLILRDEVTLRVETVLGLILDRNEEFLTFYLVVQVLRDGVTLLRVEFTMWVYALDRTEGLLSEPCSKILRDEVTLWVKWVVDSHLITNVGFLLVVRHILQDGVTLLGSGCLQPDLE